MVRKTYNKTGSTCLVTFTVPREAGIRKAEIAGDFNQWGRIPLTRRKDGRFSRTVSLEAGRRYRFRYLLDDHRWENDEAADAYVANPYGSEDSVLEV